MAGDDRPYPIRDCRGGQNSALPALAIGPTEVTSALNVEWFRAVVARKRRGSRLCARDTGSALPTNQVFLTLAGTSYNSGSNYQVLMQAATDGFYSWGTNSTPPLTDWQSAIGGATFLDAAAVVRFNGKWVIAASTGDDRLFWGGRGSSAFSTTGFVGLAPPTGNPTINSPAGAVTDTRRYRSVLVRNNLDGTQTRSEPSPETLIALVAENGEGVAVGGTATGDNNDLYDSWELQVSSDDDNFATWWVVGQALFTNNITDSNTSLLNLDPAPELGLFEPPRSHIYLGVDDNRLLMAGLYEDLNNDSLQQRVWFTPVLGDRDEGDDERIPETVDRSNYVDLDAGDVGGPITAIGPATLGDVLVFKRRQIWRLVRTGNVEAPYIPRAIDTSYGTFGYRTVCAGQDASGQPCVYFASARGPVRLGVNGPEYLGANLEAIWATVNQHGNRHTSQHAVYYADRGQYWLWVSVSGATVPSVLLIYSVATGGWAQYTGLIASAVCSAMLPRYVSEDNVGITTANVLTAPLVPYCCPNTAGQLVECDAINPQTGVALDTDLETYSGSGSAWSDGTAYAASITTPPIMPKTLDGFLSVTGGTVMADAASGVSLAVTLIPDFDTSRQRVATTTLTPVGSETVVVKRPDDCQLADARHMQVKVGDASAVASQWNVIAAEVRVKGAADR